MSHFDGLMDRKINKMCKVIYFYYFEEFNILNTQMVITLNFDPKINRARVQSPYHVSRPRRSRFGHCFHIPFKSSKSRITKTFWPSDIIMNRGYISVTVRTNLFSKFENHWPMLSKLLIGNCLLYWPTNRATHMCKAIYALFFEWGILNAFIICFYDN